MERSSPAPRSPDRSGVSAPFSCYPREVVVSEALTDGLHTLAGHEIRVHVASPEHGAPEAAPALLLHSTGMSGQQWRRLFKKLGQGHVVVAPDLIGYGESGDFAGPGAFETRHDLNVVLEVLDRIVAAHGPAHVIAHSYGGRLALLAALERCDHFKTLTCFEPVLFGVLRSTHHEPARAELEAANHDGLFLDDTYGGTEPWLERFVNYWNGPGAWENFAEPMREAFRRSGRKMFEEVRETTLDETPHTQMEGLDVPTLLISGRESTVAGRAVCEELARRMPNARLEQVDGGHMAPITNGRSVNRLIEAFLAEHARGVLM